jgi:aspartate aminotransferase-like enzyme
MREALKIVIEEGLEKRWRRHRIIADAFRRGVQSIGLGLFPAEGHRSNTLTVPTVPATIAEQKMRGLMSEKYGVVVAGGLGKIAGKTFRIGHMGAVNSNDVVSTLAALEMSLTELGHKLEPGTAVGEAEKNLVLL